MNAKAISENQNVTGCHRGCAIIFGAFFLLIGAGLFWPIFLSPALKSWAARNWRQTDCTIISSAVKERRGSKSDTYRPDIHYRYSLNGAEFNGDRYSFSTAYVSGNWAHNVVAKFPAGSNTVCYYNPKKLHESVLNRNLDWHTYLSLFLLVFVAVGIGIIIVGIRGFGTSKTRRSSVLSPILMGTATFTQDNDAAAFEGPQKLRPVESRLAKAIIIGLVGLFWNGIVSVFVAQIFNGAGWFLAVFLIPFVLVGMVMIVGTVYQLMALTNPKVEVALSNGAVPLGQSIDVAWQLRGRIGRIRKLTLGIVGTEHATYTRGTSTYTDKSIFKTIELFSGSGPQEIEFGTCTVQIPIETMHTFKGTKNKIIWTIHVRGDIPWWPNIDDAFEFFVKPAPPS